MLVVCTACGRNVVFPDDEAGSLQRCYYCKREILVSRQTSPYARTENPLGLIAYDKPAIESEIDRPSPETSPPPETPPPPPIALKPFETWGRRYLWLSLALIPLVFSLLRPADKNDVSLRFSRTLSKLSNEERRLVATRLGEKQKSSSPLDDFLAALPNHRLEGAHLSRDSWFHWVYGAGAAILFGGLLVLVFPSPSSKPPNLVRAGLFTGTIGIILLLAFQIAAKTTQGVWYKGFGVVAGLFYIVKFIGFAYASALSPSSGFLQSSLGFTFGVGYCEEVCKLLPAIRRVRRWEPIDWRGVYLLGLASGMGFGISEAITYASNYNGVQTSAIYAVRFISCVALHAIWSGAAAITLFTHRDDLTGAGTFGYLWHLLRIVSIPMVLHGLYDTLLKKQMDSLALAIAAVSFVWMALQFERLRQQETQTQIDAAT